MNPIYEKLQSCVACVRAKTDFVPKVAIVLGSGLGDYAKDIEVVEEIDYSDIANAIGMAMADVLFDMGCDLI